MAKLQIDLSGRGGLAPRYWGDYDRTTSTPELRIIGDKTQMAEGVYNPLRRYGYLSPANDGYATVSTDYSLNQIITSTIIDPDNYDIYFAEDGQQLFKGDTFDDTTLTRVLDLGTTGTPTLTDLEIYQINSQRKLFYVYKKSGNLEVGIADLPFASNDNTWLTATASGAFTATISNDAIMRVADNGYAYILHDNVVHKIDGTSDGGTNGTVTQEILKFPDNFQIVDAVDYRGNMYICIKQNAVQTHGASPVVSHSSNVGIYVWNRDVSLASIRDIVPLSGVRDIKRVYIGPSGDLRLIVITSDLITKILRFNGSGFDVIQEVGTQYAAPQYADSLTNVGQMTVWLGRDDENYYGIMYAHGRISPYDKEGLYKIGLFNDTVLSTGAIVYAGANGSTSTGYKDYKTGFFISYRANTTRKIIEWDMNGTGYTGSTLVESTNQGNVYTLVQYLPQMATVNNIEIYMAPIETSGSSEIASMKIYFNQSSTAWATKSITRDDGVRGYKRIDINKPFVNAIQLEIEFNTSQTIGSFDFAPSFAIVDYTPTNTKG